MGSRSNSMNRKICKYCAYFKERKFVKSPADTYGRWCDGFCSQKKRYTWFYNGCDSWKSKLYGDHIETVIIDEGWQDGIYKTD